LVQAPGKATWTGIGTGIGADIGHAANEIIAAIASRLDLI
jgi:hypothetical protein